MDTESVSYSTKLALFFQMPFIFSLIFITINFHDIRPANQSHHPPHLPKPPQKNTDKISPIRTPHVTTALSTSYNHAATTDTHIGIKFSTKILEGIIFFIPLQSQKDAIIQQAQMVKLVDTLL
ncbi:MAG: hypothetical protein K2L01_08060 [Rikenellaceae bacterium]|nr:hypothetical protein [Rikenellaceae bacterium]